MRLANPAQGLFPRTHTEIRRLNLGLEDVCASAVAVNTYSSNRAHAEVGSRFKQRLQKLQFHNQPCHIELQIHSAPQGYHTTWHRFL